MAQNYHPMMGNNPYVPPQQSFNQGYNQYPQPNYGAAPQQYQQPKDIRGVMTPQPGHPQMYNVGSGYPPSMDTGNISDI
jgi:hypothetical protein